jgi:hypothetical protein
VEGTGAITIGRRPDQNIVMDRKVCRIGVRASLCQEIILHPRARARAQAPAREHTVDHIANAVDPDVSSGSHVPCGT